MLNKILIVVFICVFQYLNNKVSCQTLFEYASNGNCTFYNEIEKIKNCGLNGYLISYGKHQSFKFI